MPAGCLILKCPNAYFKVEGKSGIDGKEGIFLKYYIERLSNTPSNSLLAFEK
jgi:hypothetical protein